MKASVITFGCRVNQAESLAIEHDLRARGLEMTSAAQADVIFVNSCSVTATADQGTRQTIRRIARENARARIFVTGCYATRQPEDLRDLPQVAAVVPNEQKDGIVARTLDRDLCVPVPDRDLCVAVPDAELCESVPEGDPYGGMPDLCGAGASRLPVKLRRAAVPSTKAAAPADRLFSVPLLLRPGMAGRTAFTLRVQTGCDEPCTYCIIPSTRGHAWSSPADDLAQEVRRIESAGYLEITLTGVHLGAYGRDLTPSTDLHGLLVRLLESTERVVFRLGSLEPMDCTPAIIDLAATCDRLAPAFHLPLQHASDRVLDAMARPYTCAAYDAVVTDVRHRIPHAAITADIIVGFPGETDEDADRLLEYLVGSPLTGLHVFPYSDRPGTAASAMSGKTPGAVIRDRARAVRDVGGQLSRAFRERQVGTRRRALTIDGGAAVVTDNGIRLPLTEPGIPNEHVLVRIEEGAAEIV